MKPKILFSCSISIIFVFLLATLFAGNYLTSPHQSIIGEPPKGLAAQKVIFPSKNGSTISGWFIPGEKEKGGILLMHGVRSNRLQMLERAKFLNKDGYSVLLFDFQSHGESLGKYITFGYLESLDADAALLFLKNKLSKKTIGVIGVSLGGAATLIGKVAKDSDAIILEGVYPTIEEAISNRLTIRLGHIGKYLVPLLTLQIKPRLGFNSSELRPIEKITNVKGAVFIIAGALDKHTTFAESKRLFEAAHEPKFLWELEGAGHMDFSRYMADKYQEKVLWYFRNFLK